MRRKPRTTTCSPALLAQDGPPPQTSPTYRSPSPNGSPPPPATTSQPSAPSNPSRPSPQSSAPSITTTGSPTCSPLAGRPPGSKASTSSPSPPPPTPPVICPPSSSTPKPLLPTFTATTTSPEKPPPASSTPSASLDPNRATDASPLSSPARARRALSDTRGSKRISSSSSPPATAFAATPISPTTPPGSQRCSPKNLPTKTSAFIPSTISTASPPL